MTAGILLLLLLLPAVLFNPATGDPFDYYILSLQWPPGVCSRPNKQCAPTQPQKRFTIYGYWPATHIPPSPSGTDGRPFNWTLTNFTKSISDPYLNTKLHGRWPQLYEDSRADADQRLWFEEWKEHGVCADLAPSDYMDGALRALYSLDVFGDLINKNYTPDNSMYYFAMNLKQAVAGNPGLRCYQSGAYYVLTEMRFCFNLLHAQVNCTSALLDSCGGSHGRVYFRSS